MDRNRKNCMNCKHYEYVAGYYDGCIDYIDAYCKKGRQTFESCGKDGKHNDFEPIDSFTGEEIDQWSINDITQPCKKCNSGQSRNIKITDDKKYWYVYCQGCGNQAEKTEVKEGLTQPIIRWNYKNMTRDKYDIK